MLTNLEVYSSLSSAPDLPLVLGVGADEDPIHIRNIQGLEPVKANVSTRLYGDQEGESHTGTSVGKRNIVLTLGFNPDWVEHTVSSLRAKLYAYFMPKHPVTLRLFPDDAPAVGIEGIVEGSTPNIFSQDPEMQISIICPLPDFVAIAPSVVTGEASETPTSTDFTRVGNVDTSVFLEIENDEEDETTYDGLVTFEHKTLAPGSKLFKVEASIADGVKFELNSARGVKTVENIIADEHINLLNTVTDDSVWPALRHGTNKVKVILEAGATPKPWTLTYYERFGGL